ncbi:MAG: biotin--[acetyl-CoA-carboxylase] ligase [Pseudothermotoga elfii]
MIGEKIIWTAILPSTNDFLKENWRTLSHGTAVVAEMQTNGRGRYNRNWLSPQGGLWFSILFKPRKSLRPAFFTKVCSLSVIKALQALKVEAKIKWPNDIYINGKKLAGILTESVFDENIPKAIITGIGINVNNNIPQELSNKAISLYQITGQIYDPKIILKMILRQIDGMIRRYSKKPEITTRLWKKYMIQKEGQVISFIKSNIIQSGKLLKILEESLLIEIEGKKIEISSLEILDV